jgi:hypothetical protein
MWKRFRKSLTMCGLSATLALLAGCYQIHSDDDLRTIPVTNNPQVMPQLQAQGPAAKLPSTMPY